MSARRMSRFHLAFLLAGLCAITSAQGNNASEPGALRGVDAVVLAVEGFHRDFERYGLRAAEMRRRATLRLDEQGLPVADTVAAAPDHLLIKLITNRDQYGFYHYAVSVSLSRRVPLDATGQAHLRQVAWSEGHHGIVNPSDFANLYAEIERLLGRFLAAHADDNGRARISAAGAATP